MTIYENNACYFLRKPAYIASTYGKQKSYMDIVFGDNETTLEQSEIPIYVQEKISDIGIQKSKTTYKDFIQQQKANYTKDQEYGLVNRLDTLTSGFLYFAKSPDIYSRWKDLQQQGRIFKHYLAGVDIWTQPGKKNGVSRQITTQIAHHRNGKKMLACTYELMNTRRKQKIKGKTLDAMTEVLEYQAHPEYSKNSHIQLAHICIQKGRRHQIRCHLASEAEPILGDELYHPEYHEDKKGLQLWSIGCEVRL